MFVNIFSYNVKPGSHLFCIATGSAYEMIWMRVATQEYKKVLFLRSYAHPNHFICTSGRNATQAKRCELGLIAIVTDSSSTLDDHTSCYYDV